MNPTASQRLDTPDASEVLRWRLDQLVDAGYDAESASSLADRGYVGLHVAVELVRNGCPPATALRILL